jgi:hypothetical protein
MSREYVVSAAGFTVVNAVCSIICAMPSATIGFEVIRAWVGQSANATSAQQRIQMVTKVTAFQTVTTMTPSKLKITDPTSGIVGATTIAAGKCGYNASAEGAGAVTVLWEDCFNVLNGWLWVPTPNETIIMPAASASAFALYFPVAPVTLTNWCAGFVFREV